MAQDLCNCKFKKRRSNVTPDLGKKPRKKLKILHIIEIYSAFFYYIWLWYQIWFFLYQLNFSESFMKNYKKYSSNSGKNNFFFHKSFNKINHMFRDVKCTLFICFWSFNSMLSFFPWAGQESKGISLLQQRLLPSIGAVSKALTQINYKMNIQLYSYSEKMLMNWMKIAITSKLLQKSIGAPQ